MKKSFIALGPDFTISGLALFGQTDLVKYEEILWYNHGMVTCLMAVYITLSHLNFFSAK